MIKHFNPLRIFALMHRHSYIIRQLTRRDVLLKYRGSLLGIGWSFFYPLLLLFAFSLVFGDVVNSHLQANNSIHKMHAALIIYPGLIVFSLIAEVATMTPRLLHSYPSYVKKIIFPVETLPVVVVFTASIHAGINLACFALAVLLFGEFHATLFLAPLVALPMAIFALGIAWFLAAAGVFVRDLSHAMPVLVQALMFLSPVFYTVTAVPDYLYWLYSLNPLSYAIEELRQVALFGAMPHWSNWLTLMGVSVFTATSGYAFFEHSKDEFADVL